MVGQESLTGLPELFFAHEWPHLNERVVFTEVFSNPDSSLTRVHRAVVLLLIQGLLVARIWFVNSSVAERGSIVS